MNKYITENCRSLGKAGNLAAFTIKDDLANENGAVVKVYLTFSKEINNETKNGLYGFYMRKDKNKWRIITIVAPILPPKGEMGDRRGHPGE
jgi:hypothetical protein